MGTPSETDRIILGIDPGTAVTGYGLIHHTAKGIVLLAHGVIQLQKTGLSHPLRLKKILVATLGLIDEFKPDEVAVEAPFHGENVQSMLKLGRAQGVIMAAAMLRDIPVTEYAPSKVKQAVTGNGAASKQQVAAMLASLLPELKTQPTDKPLDATDALAVALCHYLQGNPGLTQAAFSKSGKKTSGKGGWASFAAQNPDRIK